MFEIESDIFNNQNSLDPNDFSALDPNNDHSFQNIETDQNLIDINQITPTISAAATTSNQSPHQTRGGKSMENLINDKPAKRTRNSRKAKESPIKKTKTAATNTTSSLVEASVVNHTVIPKVDDQFLINLIKNALDKHKILCIRGNFHAEYFFDGDNKLIILSKNKILR